MPDLNSLMLYDQGWSDAIGQMIRARDQLSDFRPAQRAALQSLFVANELPALPQGAALTERARVLAYCLRLLAKIAAGNENIVGGPQAWDEKWKAELARRRARTEWLAADVLELLTAGDASAARADRLGDEAR